MLTGTYVPGRSLVHRATPGLKLVLLAVFLVPISIWQTPLLAGVSAAVVLVGFAVARIPLRYLLAELKPLRWFLAVLVPYQWWALGLEAALQLLVGLVISVAAASLVTLSTRVSDLLDTVQRGLQPLRRLGVDPDKVALTVSLALRAIPVVRDLLHQTLEARRARGLERSPRALATPLVIRTVRHAERVGEALAARGYDD
ncbi:energy-coupling factor transporter transmembrane protein EcfT [Arsenicicoccus piscis]|uniref:Cobalt ABC transporter n=1 Tax=Arsenicicoccus piscis TaxID=673954 RepID=A0ABQ6HJS0_9MICO|nr:energy-coupling factor transporter transmembrane protein EcfT [Arsenicicoccus piscis]MCH8627758.1 energy-coupling factor transporter transmembrane protein EcfT [Arsenicicoccus piscis]GMA18272.1 cobalt ABC transporter [Arsenicicoccus piscis]